MRCDCWLFTGIYLHVLPFTETFFKNSFMFTLFQGQASLVAQTVKNLPTMQEIWVQSLGWEVPLEKGMVTHSSILAWKIPWIEEPGKLQSMGLQRVRHDWATNTFTFIPEAWGLTWGPWEGHREEGLWAFTCVVVGREKMQGWGWRSFFHKSVLWKLSGTNRFVSLCDSMVGSPEIVECICKGHKSCINDKW